MKESQSFDISDGTEARSLGTLRKIEGLRVVVETEVEDQVELLIRELRNLRAQPRLVKKNSNFLPTDADVVYCDYSLEIVRRLPWPPGEATAALVIMLSQNEALSVSSLEAMTPDAVLARPFTANAIQASLVMGFSQFSYERRLRGKAAKLEENLRALRAIERAKSIVMSTRSVTGEEAYSYIRSQAMARRLTVSSFAEAIIASYDLLGGLPRS